MAQIIPPFEQILNFKVKPEPGELHLLKFLNTHLDESFEVYFNPYMNGDRPDIIIMKKGQGVMIIEVKDFNLDSYVLDDRKNWQVKNNQTFNIKSPISQALQYKDNLFDLHIEHLLELKIKDLRHFNMVSCAVYFHNATSDAIHQFLIKPFEHDYKYNSFLKYNIDLIGRDNLNESDFNEVLRHRYLISNRPSFLFTDAIYSSFRRFLKPPIHLLEEGRQIPYSKKQLDIIYDTSRAQQRIKGVVGSGKTTVLAGRAVQAHKRTNGMVLILTYNITLKNYIKDKISQVREKFPWANFVIANYHNFINSELNNLGIPVIVPPNFDECNADEKTDYFEKTYYSNKRLFQERLKDIRPYNVILIDEIQDYKRPWMEILKECFLVPDGEYVLFGDVKQNIYNNSTENKDVSTNVRGVTELKRCFRSDFKIKDLAIHYQQDFFKDKYDIDTFNLPNTDGEFEFERNQQGSINYIYLTDTDQVTSLFTIVHQNIINKNIPPNDITILGHSISLLKNFDAYYRYSSNEKTNTMFENHEIVYLQGLNFLKKPYPAWVTQGFKLIKIENFETKAFSQLCKLFTLYDLYMKYPDQFKEKLSRLCANFNTTLVDFLKYKEIHKEEIINFKKQFSAERMSDKIKSLRNNKKLHFYMNSGTVKISTVHSFKGWESETLFMIIEKTNSGSALTFDEVLYTGITRSRANLVLINFGNAAYHEKLKNLIEKVK